MARPINTGRQSMLQRVRTSVLEGIQNFFYRYGFNVARHPWRFISGCLVLVALSSSGFFYFRLEKNPLKLWIPQASDFKIDTDWIMETFKEAYRVEFLLLTADNVLEPRVLQKLEAVRKKVVSAKVGNITFEDVCFRIPAVKTESVSLFDVMGKRKKRSFFFFGKDEMGGLGFDPSALLSTNAYCRVVEKFPKVCLEINLPQLWSNSLEDIDTLTLDDVILKLNTTKISPVNGHPIAFPDLLGGIIRDEEGRIVGAKALLSIWMTHVNLLDVDMDKSGNAAGTNDWATLDVLDWEEAFLNTLKNESEAVKGSNVSLHYESGRSFGDISGASMFQDMEHLFIGNLLMFIFIQCVLPIRFNAVEMRLWLGCVGLMSVLLSFVTAVGLCSMAGIAYGPVHTSLPFLLLGIGVDDMFVIASCWQNLSPTERRLIPERQIAVTLRHAGLSITITSVTDFVAFLIGSLTILPCLQSFCLYAAIGIGVMYVFQATFFVAFLALDNNRMREGRNCVLWCIKHPSIALENSQKAPFVETMQSKIFGLVYDKFLLTKPMKILLLLLTIAFAGFGIRGSILLKQRFEPEWFLPENSYMLQFIHQRKHYYPDLGLDGAVFMGRTNYSQDFAKIHQLAESLENETAILKLVDSWTHGFVRYAEKMEHLDLTTAELSDNKFHSLLSAYLWSPSGARYQKNFRFADNFTCGKPAPPIEISSIDFIFRRFSGPEEHLPAMNRLKKMVRDTEMPRATVWAKIFANWVTDEVIDSELYRNLAMALACVMVCTFFLIMDFQVCLWIFLCVLLTLVDAAGFMYYWGMHIDIATCIALVLAVGLSVDFAAHIGHTFLRLTGTRQERAVNTVKYIGAATANGAFSTLLAMSLLAISDAYIFITYFKIFFLVIIFGMFHGVVFMPVVLSIIGPPSYTVDVPPNTELESWTKREETQQLNQ